MNSSPFEIPILFLTYNRLNTTTQVFKSIRKIQPKKLYISSDGPKPGRSEEDAIIEIRDFLCSNIDWECDLNTWFRNENLGCGPGVKASIDWFFSTEEKGIILEDDTVPVKSFFRYCQELLIRYQGDNRVGMISGNNHFGISPTNSSYLFSRNKGCWGWATWRRAWKEMDYEMNWLKTEYRSAVLSNMGYSSRSNVYWEENIKAILNDRVSAWDWQWYFSLAMNNQLSIFPKTNLVSNIGFGEGATHTTGFAKEAYLKAEDLSFPLMHPQYVLPFDWFDKKYEERIPVPSVSFPALRKFLKKFLPSFLIELIRTARKHING